MNTNLRPSRSGTASRVSIVGFPGGVSRRGGNMCAVILKGKAINADLILGAVAPSKESHKPKKICIELTERKI